MIQLFLAICLACLAVLPSPAGTTASPPQISELARADQAYREGRFPEAVELYASIVKGNPSLVMAQSNLIHSLLLIQKIDEAQAAAIKALAVQPNSSEMVSVMGDVQYRLAEMPQAERSYLKAEELDPRNPSPCLGLVRVYQAYSLYRRAYDQLQRAHEVAPNDPVVERLWIAALPRRDRVAAAQEFLARNDDPEWRSYLAYLRMAADQPPHACRLVSRVTTTNTKLDGLAIGNARLGGTGLSVKVNGHNNRLVIDTGTSGIVLRRNAAQKSGLTLIAPQRIGGLGDTGEQTGYAAIAQRIRIGDLEFDDCLVHVADSAGPSDQDGLIGTDVFGAYQVDLDIPGERLKLSPLPKRPDEAVAPAVLNSSGDTRAGENNESEFSKHSAQSQLPRALPKDAYVAPEMSNWSKVYRFGHLLLIPTNVDSSPPMMFMIDTGAFTNILSTRAAREVTKVRADANLHVQGMSGKVANVYRADKATLQFGHYFQKNQNIVTLDLSAVSRSAHTEVSGILGFELLRILDIKIDYRDGVVDFIYDPKRLPKEVRLKSN